MTLPKSITAYNDVAALLHQLISRGGGTYNLPTNRDAVRFAARSYKYRELLREQEAIRAGLPVGFSAPTPYDNMRISRKEASLTFIFERPIVGTVVFADGEVFKAEQLERPSAMPIPAAPEEEAPRNPVDHDLLLAAQNLMKERAK